jgi:hypothetical protein
MKETEIKPEKTLGHRIITATVEGESFSVPYEELGDKRLYAVWLGKLCSTIIRHIDNGGEVMFTVIGGEKYSAKKEWDVFIIKNLRNNTTYQECVVYEKGSVRYHNSMAGFFTDKNGNMTGYDPDVKFLKNSAKDISIHC